MKGTQNKGTSFDFSYTEYISIRHCSRWDFLYKLFDESMNVSYPGITGDSLITLKEQRFSIWLQKHVKFSYYF